MPKEQTKHQQNRVDCKHDQLEKKNDKKAQKRNDRQRKCNEQQDKQAQKRDMKTKLKVYELSQLEGQRWTKFGQLPNGITSKKEILKTLIDKELNIYVVLRPKQT